MSLSLHDRELVVTDSQKIRLLPHQIPAVGRIIKFHGPQVLENVGLMIAAIRADPDTQIELVTVSGTACAANCGFYRGENGTCASDFRQKAEERTAGLLGLEIGKFYPAGELLNRFPIGRGVK